MPSDIGGLAPWPHFSSSWEYQKGANNSAADALSQVPISHSWETVQSLLEGVIVGVANWGEVRASEELLVLRAPQKHLGDSLGSLVLCHYCQGIPCEMIGYHEDILHYQGLIQLHHGLYATVV